MTGWAWGWIAAVAAGAAPPGEAMPPDWGACEAARADGSPAGWVRLAGQAAVLIDRQEKVQGAGAVRIRHTPGAGQTILRSGPIGVEPLTRYRVDAMVRRSPGLYLHSHWQTGEEPTPLRHGLLFQTRGWTPPWPEYKPLPPVWTESSAYFSTPPAVRSIRLIFTSGLAPLFKQAPAADSIWIDDLKLVPLGPVQRQEKPGPNLLLNPSFETPHVQPDLAGFPNHWSSWWGDRQKVSLAEESAHGGRRCLRIALEPKDRSLGLVGPFVDVKPGCLYRFSVWYRGQGTLTAEMQLWADGPGYYYNLFGGQARRGSLQLASAAHPVDHATWQELTAEVVPDFPGLQWATVLLHIQGRIDLDDVSLVAAGRN